MKHADQLIDELYQILKENQRSISRLKEIFYLMHKSLWFS